MPITHSRYFDALSCIAGVLFTLAFAPFSRAYLSIIALALLFLSWQQVSGKRAMLRGFYFGLGSFGFGVSWVYISVHDYGGGGVLGSGLMAALFVLFWSIFPALAGVFSAMLYRYHYYVGTAFVWILLEYVRGALVLNGFPWLLSGYAQLDTVLSGYIPLTGVYGVGFLAVLLAVFMAQLVCQREKWRQLLTITVLVCAIGGLLQGRQWTTSAGDSIRVVLIQGNIRQDQKWQPTFRDQTLARYQALTEANWDAQLIVWPESAIPGYVDEVYSTYLQPLQLEAQKRNTDLVISVPIRQPENIKYNAVITLGAHVGSYKKNHLLPFGEYMPLQPLSGWILNLFTLRLGLFTPGGDQQDLLYAAGFPFLTSICYEDAFGVQVPEQVAYLVNVTNDAWFGNSIEPYQHLQLARMRALESGRYLLRATNTGVTAIIGPDGKVKQQLPVFTTAVLNGDMIPMKGSTPYSKSGDQTILLVLFGLYGLWLVLQFITRKTKKSS